MTLLCIIGNIAAGKSTVIEHLSPLLPDYNVFKIDDFRKAHLAFTGHGERTAQNALKMKIINTKGPCIYESSGISKNFDSIVSDWKNYRGKVVIVWLDAPIYILQMRHWSRTYQGESGVVPFTYPTPINMAMVSIDSALQEAYYDYIYDTSQISADQIAASIAALPEFN